MIPAFAGKDGVAGGGSLHSRTWDIDRNEGASIQGLKDTSTEPVDEPFIQVPDDLKGNVLVTSVDALVNWSRKSALWPVTFGLACCAFEMIATAMGRFDIARFGMEAFRASPRQADLLIIAGTVTWKMAPTIQRIYDQMGDPKWVISMGVCATSGGPYFGSYSVVPGVDHIIPVDVYVPGCPPRPDALLYGIMELHQKIKQYRNLKRPPTSVQMTKDSETSARTGARGARSVLMPVRELTGEQLAERLNRGVPDSVEGWQRNTVWVQPPRIARVAQFLRDDESLDFQFLNSVSAIDLIERFDVVYHMTSLRHQHTGVVKATVYGREDLSLPSVYQVWRGADFQEREVWDLMGIRFEGHPNMKRIMLWEGFEGHPLRKDYL